MYFFSGRATDYIQIVTIGPTLFVPLQDTTLSPKKIQGIWKRVRIKGRIKNEKGRNYRE